MREPLTGQIDHILKGTVIRSTFVNVLLSVLLKLLVFVQAVVIARLFAPAEVGVYTASIMAVSTTLLFGQIGIEQAIVRGRIYRDEADAMNTAFSLQLVVTTVLFVVLMVGAPVVAGWIGKETATAYVRFASVLVLQGALAIPTFLWVKHFRFGLAKAPFFVEWAVSFGTMLLLHYGWDLGIVSVFMGKLIGFAAQYGFVWTFAPYRPRVRIDREIARNFLSFGWPLWLNGLCTYVIWQGDQWLVLYFWGGEQLAYYVLAFTLPFFLKEFVDLASATLFPLFSRLEGSMDKLGSAFAVSNKYLAIVSVPIGIGLCVFATDLIQALFLEKWLPAAPLMQIFAIGTMISVVMGYNWGSLALAAGRSRYLLYVNLWIIGLLTTLGVYMVKTLGPIGGAIFMVVQVLLTVFLFRFAIIFRLIRSLAFLAGIWRPLLAGVTSGLTFQLLYHPDSHSIPVLAGYMVGFGSTYLGILMVLDRNIFREVRYIMRLAFAEKSPQPEQDTASGASHDSARGTNPEGSSG